MKTKETSKRVEIEEFLGPPKLLRGEDRKKYNTLLKVLTEAFQPKDLFDQLETKEMAHNIWETTRFQRLDAELVDAQRNNAIRKLADPKLGFVSEPDLKGENVNADLAIGGMVESMLLKKLNLSPELIRATSVLLAAESSSIFERMISNRIARRKATVKTYDRRKRLAAKAERLAAREQRLAAKHKRRMEDDSWSDRKWPPNNK